ncbi:threonine--tRNA ligase [Candidatus Marinamargulisbacteria bacterium SCGC AG-439-L15]|nr:threonine--tRNA ligase [Candidatus Marinamargulisbacteria bacterium SCGC AG-439-L15]
MSAKFPLSTIRHSASHVLAQAVQAIMPEAKLAIGPAIDEGFYYDFELPRALTTDDLEVLESHMNRIIKEAQEFKQFNLSTEKSVSLMEESSQSYKLELLSDLNLEEYSFYENGPFVDLCRGPHVDKTSDIGVVKLLKVSGAYWRGDENKQMLQRIYGTAFHTQEELDAYLHRLEEAEKRDHRVLGKALDLFSIQEDVGPGLILWHPKGARIRHLIETYWKEAHFKAGYELLYTPHVGRENLWKTSGHIDFYDDYMYPSLDLENNTYFARPMNCPFHIKIYQNKLWSYRDMPLRMAELGTVYRYERSGVLHGLFRVRGFTQDDAHIFCTRDQVQSEIQDVLTLCLSVLKTFGFEQYKIFISTRPEEKYVGDLAHWEEAETALKDAVSALDLSYEIDEGGGAFYGPKIDIKIKDAIGREWQCSTIQFDFNLPERFDLTYAGSDGKKHRPFMIHRALLGSIERFFGILIEHYEGKFPFWLAPTQVKILALKESVHEYCNTLKQTLQDRDVRVVCDLSKEKLGYKIRSAREERVPFMLIIGEKEKDKGMVSVRSRESGDLGQLSCDEFLSLIDKS